MPRTVPFAVLDSSLLHVRVEDCVGEQASSLLPVEDCMGEQVEIS